MNQSDDLPHCIMDATNMSFSTIQAYKYYFDGILVSVFSVIGIIANTLTIIVLKQAKFKSCFYQLLFALSCFDTLFIIFGGINYANRAFDASNILFIILFPFLIHPLTHIGMSCSIFMTLAISIERFLGICFPLKFPTQTRKAWFYIAPVTIISIGINIPRFFDAVLVWEEEFPYYVATPFRTSEPYIRMYQTYFNISFTAIMPLLTMLYLNIRIIFKIRNVQIKRFRSKEKMQKEANIFYILLSVVSTFFILYCPRIVVDIFEFLHIEEIISCNKKRGHFQPTKLINCLIHISHFTSIFNSSINFFIYSFVGKSFRREMFNLAGCSSCKIIESSYPKYCSIYNTSLRNKTQYTKSTQNRE